LTRRGLALSTALVAAALSDNTAAAAVPLTLRRVTLKAAMHFAAGGAASRGRVSPEVAALANGVLRSMRLGELKPVAAVALTLGLVVLAIWLLLLRGGRPPANDSKDEGAKGPPIPAVQEGDEKNLQGDWKMAGAVQNGERMPAADRDNFVWRFQGDKIVLELNGQVVGHSVYRLAPDQKPKAIDVTHTDERGQPKGEPETWVYELDGDTLRVCKPIEGNTARPKEVGSKPGSKTMLMELKRQPAGPAKGGPRQ
jgi:uncharacterized protein (TIGR03067 family)